MSILSIPGYLSHPTPASLSITTLLTRSPLNRQFSSPSVSSGSYSSASSIFSLDDTGSSVASSAASSSVIPPLPGPFENARILERSRRPSCGLEQSYQNCNALPRRLPPVVPDQPLPKDQLKNPRRSGRLLVNPPDRRLDVPSTRVSALPPPTLLRQSERKSNFVDSLVDIAAQIVETIWSYSTNPCLSEGGLERIIPLRTFIQETLRRSRTSYSTLQVALYYLIVLRPHVPYNRDRSTHRNNLPANKALHCGRRMFLAALIIASKYLQDRNYSARAWSKISGLNTAEINVNEITFLTAVNWKLHISEPVFEKWTNIVLKHTPSSLPSALRSEGCFPGEQADFRRLIMALTPDLEIDSAHDTLGDRLTVPHPLGCSTPQPALPRAKSRFTFLSPPIDAETSPSAHISSVIRDVPEDSIDSDQSDTESIFSNASLCSSVSSVSSTMSSRPSPTNIPNNTATKRPFALDCEPSSRSKHVIDFSHRNEGFPSNRLCLSTCSTPSAETRPLYSRDTKPGLPRSNTHIPETEWCRIKRIKCHYLCET